jgi:hypothetical protein
VREIAEECNISIGSSHDILATNAEMYRVVSRFVPRLPTQDQTDSRVAICQEILDRNSEEENVLKRIITGEETCVYGYDVETKIKSTQWVGKNSPRPKKARQVKSKLKATLTGFFLHHGFLRKGENN